jgi:hypothetical protein
MPTPAPTVTDHDDFERQLRELRKREKAHTHEGDAIAAARRRLPMTEVPPDTAVVGPDGPIPFGDVFEGRDELMVYSHMFHDGKPWERQCEGCTREDSPQGWPQSPTHSVMRTDEHGALVGPRNGGRPVPQWTRPSVTGVGVQTG